MKKNFINYMIGREIIRIDEFEILEYGLSQGISAILGIVVTFLMGSILKISFESMLFLMTFIPLRIYAGGFHSKTKNCCAIISLLIIAIALGLVRYVDIGEIGGLVMAIFSYSIIGRYAPISNVYRQLDDKEYIFYKKKSQVILCVQLVVIVILLLLGKMNYAETMIYAWVAEGGLILVEVTRKSE